MNLDMFLKISLTPSQLCLGILILNLYFTRYLDL